MKLYDLFLHWKQGDDFAHYLNKDGNNVCEALRNWADSFVANAKHCQELASRLEGEDVKAEGDTHCIWFSGNEEVLDELVKDELLSLFDDGEDWEDGEEE